VEGRASASGSRSWASTRSRAAVGQGTWLAPGHECVPQTAEISLSSLRSVVRIRAAGRQGGLEGRARVTGLQLRASPRCRAAVGQDPWLAPGHECVPQTAEISLSSLRSVVRIRAAGRQGGLEGLARVSSSRSCALAGTRTRMRTTDCRYLAEFFAVRGAHSQDRTPGRLGGSGVSLARSSGKPQRQCCCWAGPLAGSRARMRTTDCRDLAEFFAVCGAHSRGRTPGRLGRSAQGPQLAVVRKPQMPCGCWAGPLAGTRTRMRTTDCRDLAEFFAVRGAHSQDRTPGRLGGSGQGHWLAVVGKPQRPCHEPFVTLLVLVPRSYDRPTIGLL